MRKKTLLGVIAAILVVQNVAVFAAAIPPSVPPVPEPQPIGNGCYQMISYCRDAGGNYSLMSACTNMKTNESCFKFICSTCWLHQKPVIDIKDGQDPFSR